MIISVASGKGGTGKTLISTSLALSLGSVKFIDCDVEEPNANIFIKCEISRREEVCVEIPEINLKKCSLCGVCADFCNFNAISIVNDKIIIFPELCHHCGGCFLVCPDKAIEEHKERIGFVESGNVGGMEFIQGILDVGKLTGIPIIQKLKENINELSSVILDCPPGTSCSMIESVEDSDYCILVTEPTPFGLHDLSASVDVLNKMGIEFGVIINQSDIGDEKVLKYCWNNDINILMKIHYSRKIAEGYSRGESLIEVMPEYKNRFKIMFESIKDYIKVKDGKG